MSAAVARPLSVVQWSAIAGALAILLWSVPGLIATAIWALLDSTVAGGLFSFPHQDADALLHFATASIFLAGSAHFFFVERARG